MDKIDITTMMLKAIKDTREKREKRKHEDFQRAVAAAEMRRKKNAAEEAEDRRIAAMTPEEEQAEIDRLNAELKAACDRISERHWAKVRQEVSSEEEFQQLKREAEERQRKLEELWGVKHID